MPETAVDFSATLLAETLDDNPGAGDDPDAPPPVRFLRGVAKLVRKRVLAKAPTPDAAPSVFLLKPGPPAELSSVSVHHRMLDNGRTDVEGQLWFVAAPVVSGISAPLPIATDDEIWDAILGLRLGDVPAVIYDPRCSPPTVRFYPNGLEDADNCRTTEVAGTAGVTLEKILQAIDHLHLDQLVTPDGQSEAGRLWADPATGTPIKQAERTVQMHVRTALASWFPTCTIRPEQPQVTGRLDLEVEEPDPTTPGGFVRHAVLELKVLRSLNSKGNPTRPSETAKWIDEGIDQAHAYRDERRALAAVLCCFDMRAEHEDPFVPVASKAAKLGVELRVWPLFSTAKKRRTWLASQGLTEPAKDRSQQVAPNSSSA